LARADEPGDAAVQLVLGTAGHIDHGKTALILALTGVDTDRLPEEKERGITIDLGFAPLDLGEGTRVSAIDVPGHEKLVRTMVSGAAGIDLVLLVVAADEGVMPQTREHVAICDLLGIERGVVALTKSDLADDDMRELASEEVAELLEGSSLEGAPIVPVSAVSGDGIEALRSQLREAVSAGDSHTTRSGPPRLAIDRVFAMRGFGTVVTGTLVGNALSVGDSVAILPGDKEARVRGLQKHGEKVETALPGARCAINLQGVEVGEISRGQVVTRNAAMTATQTADLSLSWLPSAPESAGTASIEFLTGTAARRARLAPIASSVIAPGQHGFARLHIDGDPVPMLPGDRFIARGFSRTEGAGATLGGGTVLDVAPPHRRRSDPELRRELEILQQAELSSGLRERIRRSGLAGTEEGALQLETGLSASELAAQLATLGESGEVLRAGARLWLETLQVERMEAHLAAALDEFHTAEPLRPGMATATLRGQLPDNVRREAAELAMKRLADAGRIQVEGDLARSSDHTPTLDDDARAAVERIASEAREARFEPPSPKDWAERIGVSQDHFRDLVAYLGRENVLIRAPGDLWFDRACIDELASQVVAHLKEHGEIGPAAYKEITGTTRRTTVPLMELLDELHVTRRQGDVRVLRSG
jgi:selenocysteine-specific elongation factor